MPHSNNAENVHNEVKTELVWRNIILFAYLHVASLYGLWLAVTEASWTTVFFAYSLYVLGALGVTAGAHRLWSHRSYKARLPVRIFLVLLQTLAFQNDVFEWSRDHRLHHKFSETDADPHNVKKGFFFAHMGWLLVRKHPQVKQKGKTIDFSDLLADPVVRYQRRFYAPLVLLICFVIPAYLPWQLWNESVWVAFFVCSIFRYCFLLHITWLVNSAAHLWGYQPYDRFINPSENFAVSVGALGEGWHNYHHTFPHDYKAAELPYLINPTTLFIDFCAAVGLAYDLKSVAEDVVKSRVERTGDGTHRKWSRRSY